MTGGMMGRNSDTRMYNPHSESSHMYRENHEEESTRTGYEDPRDIDAKADRRQKKKEAEEEEDRKIRHIKVRRHHMGLGEKESPDEMPEEESKFKPRESPSEPTIPAGAGGFLTSLAAQAKGPGAAAGQMVQMSEPMDHAWSELLKRETHPGESPLHFIDYENPLHQNPANQGFTDRMYLDRKPALAGPMQGGSENVHFRITNPFTRLYHPAVLDAHDDEEGFPERKIVTRPDGTKEELIGLEHPIGYENILTDVPERPVESLPYPTFQDIPFNEETGFTKAMEHAWSELLKSKRKTEKRRKKEQRAKWRPSTGKFKRPRGGYTGRSGTSARAKLLSRHIKGGRKSGLMLPHLAVEMSHRGVASKQPMSKDPQAYGQYRAYQEQQNILGNIRPQRGARLPSSQIRMPRVPKPRLKPHRIAPIQPPKMRRPHLNSPKMPSMVTMSEDEPVSSEILKAPNRHLLIEMRNELKQLKEMMKRRDRDSKKKGMGEPDTAGAASTMPKYPGNNPKQTTRPEGATEDENDARTWGLDPIGGIVGRGGNRA